MVSLGLKSKGFITHDKQKSVIGNGQRLKYSPQTATSYGADD